MESIGSWLCSSGPLRTILTPVHRTQKLVLPPSHISFVRGGGWRAGMMAKDHIISYILAILVFFTANFLCGNANCDLIYCWTYTTHCHVSTNTFPKSHSQEMFKTTTKGTHIFTTNYLMNICGNIVVSG